MKKVGILTFHWATNYGAVLQAFALRLYLQRHGYDAEIIDYVPFRQDIIRIVTCLRTRNIQKMRKEHAIRSFREKKLKCSERYISNKALRRCSDTYDAIICGSDQVWNESFTLGAEGKTTLSYFLNFAGERTRRVAYAVSFGTTKLSDEYIAVTRNEIGKFSNISVRENSGVDLVHNLGRESSVTCDPTLLLDREDYLSLLPEKSEKAERVFGYVLHNSRECQEIVTAVKSVFHDDTENTTEDYGIEEWLWRIENSEIVVTNSFHGVMLSLILKKPFVAVLIRNSGMNDRLITLLKCIGLESRILDGCDIQIIRNVCCEPIDWKKVNERLAEMRRTGEAFLDNALGDNGD